MREELPRWMREREGGTAQGFFQRLPVFWMFQLIAWSLFAPYALLTRAMYWQDALVASLLTLVLEPLAVLFTCGLRQLYHNLKLDRDHLVRMVGVVLVSSAFAALLELAASQGAFVLLTKYGFAKTDSAPVALRFGFFWMIFVGWSLGYLWLRAEIAGRLEGRKHVAAVAAAQRAEVGMLRLQLNPQLLLNSLNNIAAEIPEQPETAVAMTRQLAEYLRYTLEPQEQLIVPLEREIEAVENYLAIERQRFGSRLRTAINGAPETLQMRVPCFLLQPLVENAVKHGLTTSSPPWDISIETRRQRDTLTIRVINSGTLPIGWNEKPTRGMGLVNLRRRLDLHYPGKHGFEMKPWGDQVMVEITLEGDAREV